MRLFHNLLVPYKVPLPRPPPAASPSVYPNPYTPNRDGLVGNGGRRLARDVHISIVRLS